MDPISTPSSHKDVARPGSATEVFAAFLKLGLTSFGGPIAHIGYFHREIVARRRWVDEAQFSQLLALSQFLPGPSSSQLGFALGLIRAGWLGALSAFVAFTLPSALLLFAFAEASMHLSGPYSQAALHGLKILAVAVVTDGLWRMARQLTPDLARILLAIGVAAMMLTIHSAMMQLAVVAVGAVLGQWLCRSVPANVGSSFVLQFGTRAGVMLIAIFGVLLALALFLQASDASSLATVAAAFYRAGAMVFGGGHVVLPLLQEAVVEPGWINREEFLVGYGAAQAVPGPMFSLSAFLGARLAGAPGALVSVLAIFLPGLLLIAAALPWWRTITAHASAVRALAGINAAVVGLLAAALYDPVWISAIHAPADLVIALIGLALMRIPRFTVLVALVWCVMASVVWTIK